MMKKLCVIFISCIAVYSCNNRTDSDKIKQNDSIGLTGSVKVTDQPAALEPENYTATTYDEIGFELMKKDGLGDVKTGMTEEELNTLLGKPDKKTKPELWGADGLYHMTWTYDKLGFIIDLAGENENKFKTTSISALHQCTVKTKRNIGIGSTLDEVKEAYKKAIDPANAEDKSTIIAGTIYGGITFMFENSKVSNIFIGASAE